jgi:hypothetical protein
MASACSHKRAEWIDQEAKRGVTARCKKSSATL